DRGTQPANAGKKMGGAPPPQPPLGEKKREPEGGGDPRRQQIQNRPTALHALQLKTCERQVRAGPACRNHATGCCVHWAGRSSRSGCEDRKRHAKKEKEGCWQKG